MPTRIELSMTGDTQISRTLLGLEERVGNLRPAWNKITNELVKVERKQFATQGAYASGGWRELSPGYKAWKERLYPGRPILVLSGKLKKSLTRKPLDVQRYGDQHMELGTSVEYAGYHQHGEGVPRRRPLELREADRERFIKIVQRYIVTGRT